MQQIHARPHRGTLYLMGNGLWSGAEKLHHSVGLSTRKTKWGTVRFAHTGGRAFHFTKALRA